jgi:LPXTG-motif cell wall-anchored protein
MEMEIILDDEIPGGSSQLPQTGEIPPIAFYSAGTLIAAMGYKLRGKREKKANKNKV